jgi:hypothetical protein
LKQVAQWPSQGAGPRQGLTAQPMRQPVALTVQVEPELAHLAPSTPLHRFVFHYSSWCRRTGTERKPVTRRCKGGCTRPRFLAKKMTLGRPSRGRSNRLGNCRRSCNGFRYRGPSCSRYCCRNRWWCGRTCCRIPHASTGSLRFRHWTKDIECWRSVSLRAEFWNPIGCSCNASSGGIRPDAGNGAATLLWREACEEICTGRASSRRRCQLLFLCRFRCVSRPRWHWRHQRLNHHRRCYSGSIGAHQGFALLLSSGCGLAS